MNTGVQDAHNLAWKLALVVRNRASGAQLGEDAQPAVCPTRLLQSYEVCSAI